MKEYDSKDRLITKDDWEKWLKLKEEYSDKRLSNMPETPTKKETKYAVIEWHKYPEEKPHEEKEYLVSITDIDIRFSSSDYWNSKNEEFHHFIDDYISAWAEMPKPYKGES